ncbi:MAG TPA: Ldh family oxidoreductase [Gaiellaceae bacterium]|nr:Ldh family oxidoreductase [Gaiellaceae bacterium]
MRAEDVVPHLRALGFSEPDAATLADHFLDAERRGKRGHGLARVEWLGTLPGLRPQATPRLVSARPGMRVWDGNGAVGYLTLAAMCDTVIAHPPPGATIVVARRCFPTGVLGYWVRRLADAGLVALLTATSPARLPHPEGGEPLVGTIPLAIGIPSSDGKPLVSDVSMAKATYGEVLAGLAPPEDLVPFGGEQAHKAFALAVGLSLAAEALADDEQAALLVVAKPEGDPVPGLRARAAGLRLPGDR